MSRFEKGQALVECALFIPLLMVILMGAIEYTHMYQMSLRASNLSRTIANVSFRDCAYLEGPSSQSCLRNNAVRVLEEAELLFEDFGNKGTIISSSYAYDSGSSSQARLVAAQSAGRGNYESHFSQQTVDEEVIEKNERIVIGEILYPYEPITPLGSFMGLLNIRTVIYEITIF